MIPVRFNLGVVVWRAVVVVIAGVVSGALVEVFAIVVVGKAVDVVVGTAVDEAVTAEDEDAARTLVVPFGLVVSVIITVVVDMNVVVVCIELVDVDASDVVCAAVVLPEEVLEAVVDVVMIVVVRPPSLHEQNSGLCTASLTIIIAARTRSATRISKKEPRQPELGESSLSAQSPFTSDGYAILYT
jgi:hypothetical protein